MKFAIIAFLAVEAVDEASRAAPLDRDHDALPSAAETEACTLAKLYEATVS
jgi:hypothetical protein